MHTLLLIVSAFLLAFQAFRDCFISNGLQYYFSPNLKAIHYGWLGLLFITLAMFV